MTAAAKHAKTLRTQAFALIELAECLEQGNIRGAYMRSWLACPDVIQQIVNDIEKEGALHVGPFRDDTADQSPLAAGWR